MLSFQKLPVRASSGPNPWPKRPSPADDSFASATPHPKKTGWPHLLRRLFLAHSRKHRHHQILNNLGSRVSFFSPQIPMPHLQVSENVREEGGKNKLKNPSFNLGEGEGREWDVNVAAVWGETEPDAAATSGKWGEKSVGGERHRSHFFGGPTASGPRKEKQASPPPPPHPRPKLSGCLLRICVK